MLKIAFIVVIFGLWVWRLRVDFRRDSGSNRRAKVFHVLSMLLLTPYVFSLSSVSSALTGMARSGTGVAGGAGVQMLWWGSTAAILLAVMLFFGLGSRNPKARKAAIAGFPFMGLVVGASFNHGIFEGVAPASGAGWAAYVILALVFFVLFSLPALFYGRQRAREFFALGPLTKEHVRRYVNKVFDIEAKLGHSPTGGPRRPFRWLRS